MADNTHSEQHYHHHHQHDESGSKPYSPRSMEVTTRSDLSFLYRVLRAVIKPLRPRLVRPSGGGSGQTAGSPRLSPPTRKGKRWPEIAETQCEGVWMYRFRAVGRKGKGSVGRVRAQAVGDAEVSAAAGSGGRQHGETTTTTTTTTTSPPTSSHRHHHHHHRIYYFCGGGFQSPPAPEHWRFLAQLTHDLDLEPARHHSNNGPVVDNDNDNDNSYQHAQDLHPDTEIELVLVSYPLAPTNPASESLRILRTWFAKVMDEAVERGHTLSLMGDSSGGNVVLSLGFWAVQHYGVTQSEQQQQQVPCRAESPSADDDGDENRPDHRGTGARRTSNFPLRSLISISGPTDLTNSNPEIRTADKLDCVLTAAMTREVAEVWTGNVDKRTSTKNQKNGPSSPSHDPTPLADPSVSPLLNPDAAFHALRGRGVAVHGVVGTHDVLAPDAVEFMRKCRRLGVRGRWLVWDGQMHCFPLAGGRLGIREGSEGREFVVGVIRRDCGLGR
ncbi:hypothetical protein AYL99_02950 [Fonsecaea erecta]|uniref:Alpha/beta hydrolase fold-3 domain-containing protein n=1 Tax=Fonsecaea erecta TaxID=1367422 RepID=A0A178ZWR6_9EURO|nr:hypothetical protein AYL99_02950 [Fonsecaea erecta]OAP63723.1 hypothetical protein AYL99_02950 [Fonsecaea erecta]